MVDVVVVGSVNLDLVVRSSRLPGPGETLVADAYDEYPGGKGLNQAVAAARAGATVMLYAATGDDDAGRRLVTVARDEGIDVTSVITVGVPTGRALITVDRAAENTILVVPGANAVMEFDQLARCSVVVAQLEIPEEVVTRAFTEGRRHGAITMLNPSPAAPISEQLLALTDVIVPNEHEVELIGGVAHLLAAGVSTVVVTRGVAGADVTTLTSATVNQPSIDVEPVDTTGAGDAFCGVLAARLAEGAELGDAVRWANAAGGLATTAHGAVPSLPTRAEIVDAQSSRRSRPR